MKTKDLRTERQVCDFCNPDHHEQLVKLTNHLETRHGWVGGFTREKADEYQRIREKFQKGLRKPCFCIQEEDGKYICSEHLIELATRMAQDNNQGSA